MIRLPHREDKAFSIVFLLVLIAPLLFVPTFQDGFEAVKFPLFLFLTGAGSVALFWRKKVVWNKFAAGLLAAVVVLCGLSTIFSIDVINSVVGLYGRYTGSLIFTFCWTLFIFLVANIVGDSEDRKLTLLRVLVFDAVLVAVLGITQTFNIAYYAGPNPGARPIIPSFIGNQNFSAMFLVGLLPAAILLWNEAQKRWAKYYYALAAVIMTWCVVLSGSRGAMIGLVVMLVAFAVIAVWRKYPARLWQGAVFVALVSAAFFAAFFSSTRADVLSGQTNAQYTAETRYLVWDNAVNITKHHPWFGTGPGNFFIALEQTGDLSLSGNERFDDAHNLILNLAVNLGIPFTIAFLWLIGLVVLRSWRRSNENLLTALWIIPGLGGVLAAGSFNPVSISIWILLGIMIAYGANLHNQEKSLPKVARGLGILAGALLMVVALLFISSETLSNYGLRAYHYAKDYSRAEQFFAASAKLNPFNDTANAYLIGSRIHIGKDLPGQSKAIDKFESRHLTSAGSIKSSADLEYMLYEQNHDPAALQRMNYFYDEAIRQHPNFAVLYGSAAYAEFKTGNTDRAIDYLNRQLALPDSDKYPFSWILMAKLQIDRGQNALAVDALQKAYSQLSDQLILKKYLDEVKTAPDPKKLNFPVYFPDIDI